MTKTSRLTICAACVPCIAIAQALSTPPASPLRDDGNGQPVATSGPARRARTVMRDAYTLAFVDADVRRVVDAVLGSMLGVDYTLDPKVTGNITLRTAHPVSGAALIPLLETALQSVDAVVVSSGGSYRIVSRSDARGRAVAGDGEKGSELAGYTNEVVTLRYGSAHEITRLLTEFLGKDIVGGIEPASNQIIITGSTSERRAAHALIARFDVDTLAGMNYRFYKLENVDPDTLVGELERIFKPPFDIIGTRVRVVPLPRLRSVLIIAAERNDLNRIEPWIRQLDAGASGKRKLYSYPVQNGRARDIAASLQLVLGAQSSASPASSASVMSAPAPGGGDPGAGASTGIGQSMGAMASAKEPSQAVGPQTPLPGSSTPVVQPGSGNGPRIVPNEDTNALLIYANGEEYELIKQALEKIDLPVPQILIEATLAEVTLTKDFSAGIDWSILSGKSSARLGNTVSALPTAIFPGFSYAYIGQTVQAVLNTLQSKTKVRVLSAPKLMVLNNQTATLQVGDQVPIVTQQSQSVSAAGAPIVNAVELHDTGVILKVTPRVNDSGAVQLDIAQEVSDVTPTTTSGINSPTIQQRRLATTVTTRSGQLVALGGLIRNTASRQKSGIPLLSQIPIVGAAFGNQAIREDQTELIILMTPTVLRTPEDASVMVDELLDRMEDTRPLVDTSRRKPILAPVPKR